MASALEALQQARSGVRRAIDEWDASDLSRVETNIRFLEESVDRLRSAEQELRHCRPEVREELVAAVIGLKQDIARISRVVDAGASFYRGLALRLMGSASTYTPSGRMAPSGLTGATENVEA
jgi:hypothetical protein